ncbi:hypothetical protein [Lentilitoribacter sp. EG35]|uniref:hypothetical protein n=1 Tax=Lentilitoribacter sp. EG35 TaxID=3234192 RepID=UPI00345F70FD
MATNFEKVKTDWWRLIKLFAALIFSAFVGYKFQPEISGNKDAINTIVTIFSILAGFLIAIITLISEPILRQAKDWTELQGMKSTIRRKLLRQNMLFFLYLLTLGLALIMFVVPSTMVDVQKYMQMGFLGLATFVFLASFTLPGSLLKIQMDRYDAELNEEKPEVIKSAQKTAREAKNP